MQGNYRILIKMNYFRFVQGHGIKKKKCMQSASKSLYNNINLVDCGITIQRVVLEYELQSDICVQSSRHDYREEANARGRGGGGY